MPEVLEPEDYAGVETFIDGLNLPVDSPWVKRGIKHISVKWDVQTIRPIITVEYKISLFGLWARRWIKKYGLKATYHTIRPGEDWQTRTHYIGGLEWKNTAWIKTAGKISGNTKSPTEAESRWGPPPSN